MFGEFLNKKILITGGVGFIGSNLAIRLVDLGAKVTLIDSLKPEYGGNEFNVSPCYEKVRLIVSDVRDDQSLKVLLKEQDFLFNLAGQTSHMDSMTEPFVDLDINCRSQLSILEACRQVNPGIRIIYSSTRQLYGRPRYLPVDELHPVKPVDVNGINKLAGEFYHLLYSDVYGIRSTVLRLTNVYGPRMRIRDARQTFIGIWIRRVLENEPFDVWGGKQLRDFTFVSDCVDAMLSAAIAPQTIGGVYNVGGVSPVSLEHLAALLVKINGGGSFCVKEFPADRKKIDIGDFYCDDKLFRSLTSWCPKITLEEGLEGTLCFYRENLGHYV